MKFPFWDAFDIRPRVAGEDREIYRPARLVHTIAFRENTKLEARFRIERSGGATWKVNLRG